MLRLFLIIGLFIMNLSVINAQDKKILCGEETLTSSLPDTSPI